MPGSGAHTHPASPVAVPTEHPGVPALDPPGSTREARLEDAAALTPGSPAAEWPGGSRGCTGAGSAVQCGTAVTG